MDAKNYSEIMNLPQEQREARFQKEKENIFSDGSRSAEVLSYLSEYINKEILNHFTAFSSLPMGANIEQFQTVWHSLNAVQNLEADLRKRIEKANKLSTEQANKPIEKEDDFTNV